MRTFLVGLEKAEFPLTRLLHDALALFLLEIAVQPFGVKP